MKAPTISPLRLSAILLVLLLAGHAIFMASNAGAVAAEQGPALSPVAATPAHHATAHHGELPNDPNQDAPCFLDNPASSPSPQPLPGMTAALSTYPAMHPQHPLAGDANGTECSWLPVLRRSELQVYRI